MEVEIKRHTIPERRSFTPAKGVRRITVLRFEDYNAGDTEYVYFDGVGLSFAYPSVDPHVRRYFSDWDDMEWCDQEHEGCGDTECYNCYGDGDRSDCPNAEECEGMGCLTVGQIVDVVNSSGNGYVEMYVDNIYPVM